MLHRNSVDDVVLALADADIDPRTGNKVIYSANWIATNDSMVGKVNPDWVRRELAWFVSGSNALEDMEGPVPTLFQACAGYDGKVNSSYGHILFGEGEELPKPPTLMQRVYDTFINEGAGTRHAVAVITDRDIHELAKKNGRRDFICTNVLNFMIDENDYLHIIAQMRSMDAVFGYRADYSMWDYVMELMVDNLSVGFKREITRGHITFQVANLHVYPRHFEALAVAAADIQDRLDRRVWAPPVAEVKAFLDGDPHHAEPAGTGEARIGRAIKDQPQA